MSYTVYMHLLPNGKRYIGITGRSVEKRWGNNGVQYQRHSYFYNAIQKYGWDNIDHVILKDNVTKDQACELEKYYIQLYKTTDKKYGYNRSIGGEFNSEFHYQRSQEFKDYMRKINTGRFPSEETRKKQSLNNGMHNPEVVERVKQSLKKSQKERTAKRMATMKERYPEGLKQSKESNLKRSQALKGKPKSEETKQKMRKSKSPEAIENMKKAQKEAWKRRKKMELTKIS